ncbi:hypothetical protein F4859DRAFT_295161 [Xylaria cf. heliscus]|nr:hypothetical protein F4859DRAFT_295161 [Xylaria cf. heliscus]
MSDLQTVSLPVLGVGVLTGLWLLLHQVLDWGFLLCLPRTLGSQLPTRVPLLLHCKDGVEEGGTTAYLSITGMMNYAAHEKLVIQYLRRAACLGGVTVRVNKASFIV